MSRKAVIVSPNDSYGYKVRTKYLEECLLKLGYSVMVLSSDFDHRRKQRYNERRDNLELIHVPTYSKNISLARIKSHLVFSKKVFLRLTELKPDLVYCSAPPNYLYKYTAKYKRINPSTKLIFEVGDLWPETLPFNNRIKLLLHPCIKFWARIRDTNLKYADKIIYECNLFEKIIERKKANHDRNVIYLGKEDFYQGRYEKKIVSLDVFRVAYVGSINNIIDIDLIISVLKNMSTMRNTIFVIIGDGEKKNALLRACHENGLTYEYYGIVYDEQKKHDILKECHFGFNIMKNSVAVGVTMKSLEYFHEGLILINNIPADTTSIVEKYECGFNVSRYQDTRQLAKSICDLAFNDIQKMMNNSRTVYENFFDTKSVNAQLYSLFKDLYK